MMAKILGQTLKILLAYHAYKPFLKLLAPAACLSFLGFCESDGNFFYYYFLNIAVADDSTYHVSTLCVGPAEQRHDCIVLVWNKI